MMLSIICAVKNGVECTSVPRQEKGVVKCARPSINHIGSDLPMELQGLVGVGGCS